MSVVERKSAKQQQEKLTTTSIAGTKQKGVQTKMNIVKTVKDNAIDDASASGTGNSVYDKIYNLVGKGASTSMGQFTIDKMDNLLTIVEKTAKWSLPDGGDSTSGSENTKENKSPKLERPCGWAPFLFLIVTLRCARVGLSFGSIMIGNEPVTPESMVQFLQTRRRKLRAIKCQGLKTLRIKQRAAEERAKRMGIIEQLTSIFNLVVCRPGKFISCNTQIITTTSSTTTITSNTNAITVVKDEKKSKNLEDNDKNVNTSNSLQQVQAQKRPLEEDDASANESDSDEELHCTQLLDKYGDRSSDLDDPDYIPGAEDGEVTSSSETDEDSDENTDEGVSEDDTINNEIVSEEEPKNLTDKNVGEKLEILSLHDDNTSPKENGPSSLSGGFGGNVSSEKELNRSDKQDNSTSSSSSIPPLSTSPTLSDSSPTKSTAINPVRVSPKIAQNGNNKGDEEIYENFYDPVDVYDYDVQRGLRVRCQDLTRLSYGDECFFSPIGSPLINDGAINNYLQSQLPSVVINSAPSTSLNENAIPYQPLINTNEIQMLTHERMNTDSESNKGNLNNLKSQNNHQQKNQQNKKGYYNNYKPSRGRKLH